MSEKKFKNRSQKKIDKEPDNRQYDSLSFKYILKIKNVN